MLTLAPDPRDKAAVAKKPTLHHASVVGGKSNTALCNLDMYLIGEADRFEKLI
jgi:hypothetical protein